MAERLGEMFIRKGLLNREQLDKALQEQPRTGEYLGQILIRFGFVKELEVLKVLAEQFKTYFVQLKDVRFNPTVMKMVPAALVWEHKFIPIDMRAGVLLIAVSNPLNMWPISVLQEKLSLIEDVQIVIAREEDIMKYLSQYYPKID